MGVPLGRGSIDLPACYRLLARHTKLTRICIEVCYGYRAAFRVPEGQGGGGRLDSGAFRVGMPLSQLPEPNGTAAGRSGALS